MGLLLPAELAPLLTAAGGGWPEADEDLLHASAEQWHGFADRLRERAGEVDSALRQLRDGTADPDRPVVAERAGGPAGPLTDGALAAEAIAFALAGTARVVLELKAVTVAQLGLLAARLAAAVPDGALAEWVTATAMTGAALRQAGTRAAEVLDGAVVRVLTAAENRLRTPHPPHRS